MNPTLASLFVSAEGGDSSAGGALFAALYSELHRLAQKQLARGASGLTLGTTTLLHEAYLNIAQREGTVFPDRNRFMGYAARVMRALIIDHVRHRKAVKRGGRFEITSLPTEIADPSVGEENLVRIAEGVDALARVDPLLAQVVDLHFFCGFSFDEIGAMQGLSKRTVQRQWVKARLFLHDVIGDEDRA